MSERISTFCWSSATGFLVLCGGKVSGIVPGRGADKNEVGMMMTKIGREKTGMNQSYIKYH